MHTFFAANSYANNFKNNYKTSFLKLALQAAKIFKENGLIKLHLKAKLIQISINLQFYKYGKANEFIKEL